MRRCLPVLGTAQCLRMNHEKPSGAVSAFDSRLRTYLPSWRLSAVNACPGAGAFEKQGLKELDRELMLAEECFTLVPCEDSGRGADGADAACPEGTGQL
jgi:hypothetical protein